MDDAPAIFTFGFDNVLKKHSPSFTIVAARYASLSLDGFKGEICGIDLTMQVRVGDADCLAFVLENEHVCYVRF
jgi:hypothetical protein